MAIEVDGARLESGVGSASFNGTSLTRIDKDATTVWLAPNDSRTCCCAKFIDLMGISDYRVIQFGDDTVNDEIVLKMHIDYDPNVSMTYELCACVYICACYCYGTAPGTCATTYCTGSWCGSLGCKTIESGQCKYGCWDTEAHHINISGPSNVCCSNADYGSRIKLKLINHTMGVESDWQNWSTGSTNTHFYV